MNKVRRRFSVYRTEYQTQNGHHMPEFEKIFRLKGRDFENLLNQKCLIVAFCVRVGTGREDTTLLDVMLRSQASRESGGGAFEYNRSRNSYASGRSGRRNSRGARSGERGRKIEEAANAVAKFLAASSSKDTAMIQSFEKRENLLTILEVASEKSVTTIVNVQYHWIKQKGSVEIGA